MEKEKVKDVSNAKEYNIYAGLGGATYQYTGLFNSQEEAEEEAHLRACEEQAINDGCDPDTKEFEVYISELFQEDTESWIKCYATLTSEDTETPEDDLIRDYIIEDGNSIGETSSQGS